MLSTLGQSLIGIWEVDLINLSDQPIEEKEEKIQNDRKEKYIQERKKGQKNVLISEIIRLCQWKWVRHEIQDLNATTETQWDT